MKIFILLLLILLYSPINSYTQDDSKGVYGWASLGDGVNGKVYAVCQYNGYLYAGGNFDTASGVAANNIAYWDGTNWHPLLEGTDDIVYSLIVFNNELIVGGKFDTAGSVPNTRGIAKWNGSSWSALGTGTNKFVHTMIIYNSSLIVGGQFSNVGSNIAKWDGSSWSPLGTGVDKDVYVLTVFNNEIIVGGIFIVAGGVNVKNIAKWNGTTWSALSNSDFEKDVSALTVYNDTLIAGGDFRYISGNSRRFIAKYNGTSWESIGDGIEDKAVTLTTYNGDLIVGGKFKFVYLSNGDSIYLNRIAKWDGSSWTGFSTGMNNEIYALYTLDSNLIAGGKFTTAGGRYRNGIASWEDMQTFSLSGTVTYNTTRSNVNGGYVKACRLDMNTREVLVLDSAQINPVDGSYILNNVVGDSIDVIAFPNDMIINDYVPTYYPSTIHWENAHTINLKQNLENINLTVFRAYGEVATGSIGDDVLLNYLPEGLSNGQGLPFKSDAIIYAKIGNTYKNFNISSSLEKYNISSLPAGNYSIIATRMGYKSDSMSVILTSGASLDTIDFALDTLNSFTNPISVRKINTEVPDKFILHQNYPNPFNPVTNIKFDIPKPALVKIDIYDVLGREIIRLLEMDLKSGSYSIAWNAVNYSSGVYFYKLDTDEFTDIKKMLLIK